MTTSDPTRALNQWIEISRDAYLHNLAFLRSLVGEKVELSVVVKSNAYGHGLVPIARLAVEGGADSFCVHSLEEAVALRDAGFDQDVLVMGHVPIARLDAVVEHDFRMVLYDAETARSLAAVAERRGRRARVHLKIETGTHRQGVEGEELVVLLDLLRRSPSLDVEGVYTHFADIEDTTDHAYARRQLERFRSALDAIREAGFSPVKRRHAACSAATLLFDETHFDMARVGIAQYGFWSSRETRLSYEHRHGAGSAASALRPVLAWKARISQVKTVPADAWVGYGRTWQTTRETRLAVLPIGYADGYDRHFSNAAWALVGGRRAPVRGRVCMNLVMIDVTDVPGVGLEDEVVLLGRQGEREVTAEDLAGIAGTISYEIVARLGAHIPRRVVD